MGCCRCRNEDKANFMADNANFKIKSYLGNGDDDDHDDENRRAYQISGPERFVHNGEVKIHARERFDSVMVGLILRSLILHNQDIRSARHFRSSPKERSLNKASNVRLFGETSRSLIKPCITFSTISFVASLEPNQDQQVYVTTSGRLVCFSPREQSITLHILQLDPSLHECVECELPVTILLFSSFQK